MLYNNILFIILLIFQIIYDILYNISYIIYYFIYFSDWLLQFDDVEFKVRFQCQF